MVTLLPAPGDSSQAATPASAPQPAAASSALQPYEATYVVTWHGIEAGTSAVKLEHNGGDRWTFTSVSSPSGLARLYLRDNVTQRSVMQLTPDGIQPLQFLAENPRTSGKIDSDLKFDWHAHHATGTYDEAPFDLDLKPGVQDDLSAQIALIDQLSAGRSPEGFSMVNKNSIRDYRFSREREEILSTPMGPVATVVYRSERSHSPRTTRYWCAPSLGYVPLRAEQRREDKVEWTMDVRSVKRG